MYIDSYVVLGGVTGLLIFIIQFTLGWFVNSLFSKIKDLEGKDERLFNVMHELAVLLPTNYTSKQDFKEMGDKIFGALRRIEESLDNKVDKVSVK